MKLYSVQYQAGPGLHYPKYWHTIWAENEEAARDFVAELYGDVFDHKAEILQVVETQGSGLPWGQIRPLPREHVDIINTGFDELGSATYNAVVKLDNGGVAYLPYKGSMKKGYRFPRLTCPDCGKIVSENWYIKHRKSGCKKG